MRRYSWLLVIGLCGLPGCGFQPLYDGAGVKDTGAAYCINVNVDTGRENQALENLLTDRLQTRCDGNCLTLELDVDLKFTSSGLALASDGTYRRYLLTADASYKLKPSQGEHPFLAQTVTKKSSFVVSEGGAQAAFATTISDRKERENMLVLLADDIALNTQSFLKDHPEPATLMSKVDAR